MCCSLCLSTPCLARGTPRANPNPSPDTTKTRILLCGGVLIYSCMGTGGRPNHGDKSNTPKGTHQTVPRRLFISELAEAEEAWHPPFAKLQKARKSSFPVFFAAPVVLRSPSLRPPVSTGLLFRSLLLGLWQDGYDHSYFFISSFIEDHVNMHAECLLG